MRVLIGRCSAPLLFVAFASAGFQDSSLQFSASLAPSFQRETETQKGGEGQVASDQTAQEEELQAKITKYLDLSKNGRVAVRPQAARRLVKMGEPALIRIREACGPSGEGLAGLGTHMVEVLGEFGDPELRAFLWASLEDLDFPWRGPAARSLSKSAQAAELPEFYQLMEDRLDQVRVAAVDSLAVVVDAENSERDEIEAAMLQELLQVDPSDRVRRSAALRLDDLGHSGYLLWLVEDLKRTDSYFRLPLGEQARFASVRALKKRLGSDFGFRAEKPPAVPDNIKAIEEIRSALLARSKGIAPEVPDAWRAAAKTEGDLIGLELRSCRVGEFFLRWNRADVLHVGTGVGRKLPLAPGTVARLETALQGLARELGETRYWGKAGCDLEQLRLVNAEGVVDSFLISKGQAALPDLRPSALDKAVKLLLDSIPKSNAEDAKLRSSIQEALELLGGPF